jgi:hypothetical protein
MISLQPKSLEQISSQETEASQKKTTILRHPWHPHVSGHTRMDQQRPSSTTAGGGLLVAAEEDVGEDGLGLQRRLEDRQALHQNAERSIPDLRNRTTTEGK